MKRIIYFSLGFSILISSQISVAQSAKQDMLAIDKYCTAEIVAGNCSQLTWGKGLGDCLRKAHHLGRKKNHYFAFSPKCESAFGSAHRRHPEWRKKK